MSSFDVMAALRVSALAASASIALAGHGQAVPEVPGDDGRIEIALATAPQLQTLERYLQSNTLRASTLLGKQVQNRGGHALGEVTDIAVRDGTPSRGMSLIVTLGDALPGGGMQASLPLDEVQISSNGSQLFADAARAVPQRDPLLSDAPQPAANAAATPTRSPVDRSPAAGASLTGSVATGDAATADRVVASLIGADVLGSDGRPAAVIDDFLISTAGIDSLRVVLKVGGTSGNGEKRVALPFEQLVLARGAGGRDGEEAVARVAMDLQTLQRQPAFMYELRTPAR